jgi:hypothetical protein
MLRPYISYSDTKLKDSNQIPMLKPAAGALALALAACSTHIQAAPLTLVKDGRPNATIVLQANAPEPLKAAATDLQKYVQKMSGVELPLTADGNDVPGTTLNIGKTVSSQASDLPDSKLNPETYAITQRGDDVYFCANYPSPTAFAVYSFLQDNLGVRWFAPGDDWEYVPQLKNKNTLTVDVTNVVSVPGTSPRIWSGHQWTPAWKTWEWRNKAIISEKVPRRNFQNNMFRIFPQSKYRMTHPEYYPLVSGKRWIPKDDKEADWWPCIGSPEVQRITVEHIQQWFKDHPSEDSFSLGMDDIVKICEDPQCLAMDGHSDDLRKRNFSSRFYKFINIIAREIKTSNPDKFIGVLIYRIVLEPPVDVPKMEDNVFGYIAFDSCAEWYLPGRKAAWMSNVQEWAKRMKHLSRYEYFGLGTFAPRVYHRSLAEQMEVDHSLGFEGNYTEMYTFLPQTAPMAWALAQKQWHPKLKMDALLGEFYKKMYGPAAPTMKQYFDLMEKSWNINRPGHIGWVNMDIVHQATSISSEALEQGMALLNKAANQVQTPVAKRRIDVTRAGLQYAGYAIQEYALAQRISTTKIPDAATANKTLGTIKKFGALMAEREKNWPLAFGREDLLGDSLRGLKSLVFANGTTYLQTDVAPLEAPALPGVLRLLDWYQDNQPQQVEAVTKQLVDALPPQHFRDVISAWSWVRQNRPTSLLINGSFEDISTNKTAAAQNDWSATGAPNGWSTWSTYPDAKFARATGRSGNGFRAQCDTGDSNNAAVLQNAPLHSGKTYLGTAWVKLAKPEQASGTTLTFRFRTANGWFEGNNAKVFATASPSTEWQPLFLSATVPEGASAMSFMLCTSDGDAVFDDAALYEIGGK